MTDDAIEMHVPRKGAADVLTPLERRLPPPGPGEVRVAVEAAGVAYADIMMRQGVYAGQSPPVTPGYDFVGRIEAVGAGVTELAAGQRVAGVTVSGSYATRRNVNAQWLAPAPEGVDAAKLVAAVLNGVTAWQMFHRIASPAPGEWVLVHGAAGGVGNLLLELARIAGVKAIGTASASKAEVVRARGGEPVDYRAEDVAARARALSGGGVVAAFDHLGGKHFKKVSMAALRPGGVGVLYGAYDMTRDGKVNPLAIADLVMNASFSSLGLFGKGQGVVAYSAQPWRDGRPLAYQQDLAAVLKLVGDGVLSPLVGATFPLREAAQAHRALETRSVAGKIVLVTA
ncbi:MAG: medium chain dehydrogenase/reductase family protein [Phenylobacterium sp.]|uniref:medium chain dehydrogenase/reductase family protein n=1 Tax=Phenylobacterium sp. TaxID=1871053 RepID=UPI002734A335|nr:medium chain dehydrogenase/reductase family protein [Phenylobacterium sp.]MDP3748606.1 medium chain dehydrogenase/reductase family protein [Phenylobacterium sp.]